MFLHKVSRDGLSSQHHLELWQICSFSYFCWEAVPEWYGPGVISVFVVVCAGRNVAIGYLMALTSGHSDWEQVQATVYCY